MDKDKEQNFTAMFEPLYAPIPDTKKYLERIGLDSVENTDKDTLDRIILSHQRNVPFENLDIFDAGLDISLSIPELYDKIVLRRRGGYCFELNTACSALLTCLGFDCYSIVVRVVWNHSCMMPLSHCAMIVTIGGLRYFCDVGFGGPSPQSSLLLDVSDTQVSGPNTFIFDNDANETMLCLVIDGDKTPILSFTDTPWPPVDFLALNEYQSKSKNSFFKATRLCNLVTATGSITLSDNVLKVHSGELTDEKTLETESDFHASLLDHFGIVVNFPLKL